MQPFGDPGGPGQPSGLSGLQLAYDARRLRYLESLGVRAFLKGRRFTAWNDAERRRAPVREVDDKGKVTIKSPYDAGNATLCDAVHDVGLDRLDPRLEVVTAALDRLPDQERDARQRDWLLHDDRATALARALLVRAQPDRQDELFGWVRADVSPEQYWATLQVPTVHMSVLLETADFGANEVIRLLYLLDETPEHLLDAAALWRDDALARDPNLPESVSTAVRNSFTSFKYWFDDPFRCQEFSGDTDTFRMASALNGHEDMAHGQDMTYWSENHRILFATAEYLAGQFWPDEQFVSMRAHRKEGQGGPPRKGDMTGREHMAHARKRVLRWLDERLRIGFSEWNSPGYYVYDIIPVLNLADFAVEPAIRTRAAMVMDLLTFDLALNSPTGAMAGSAGRVYFEGKNCVWEQGVRNPSELLFGRLNHFSESTFAAASIATSPSYRPPDALIQLARKGPTTSTARSRVSITFDEAPEYGVGVRTAEDMEFWWSRAAYATKQTILGSRAVATEHGLLDTPPFSDILPAIKSAAAAIETTEDVGAGILGGLGGAVAGFAVAGPLGAIAGGAAGAVAGASAPSFTEVDAADLFSVLTEGSVLTRGNLYVHRSDGASLASVQNFRRGQINFQAMPCVAALDNGAMVWTSYPSAGSYIDLNLLFGLIHVDHAKVFPAGHDGPNWWTGNAVQPRVVQEGAAAITAYDAKETQKLLFGERTHAWFPKDQFDEVVGPTSARCNHDSARWFFGRAGDSYVGLFCALETTWTDNGPWKDKEIRVGGPANVFITQIGGRPTFGSFERFVAKVSMARVHVSGLHTSAEVECSYDVPFGERLELHYDSASRYGGEALEDDDYPRHHSPVARIAWQQDRYAVQHDGRSLVHDLVKGTRAVGGALTELVHDTPMSCYGQNMGLLPWPLYKGVDRDGAIGGLIARLREVRPDLVGLSEMWTAGDRQTVIDAVRDIYPYSVEGPHDPIDLVVTDVEVMGGGLLLLSRHRILTGAATVYRQCSGDDCLANKGALHARVERRGSPSPVDVFLTHTQAAHPTIGGTTAGARTAVEAQIRHLAAFVRASRDPAAPAVLFGDLNVDQFAHPDLYAYLMSELGGPEDPGAVTGLPGAVRPTGTSESDDGTISSFHDDHPARSPDDPARFGPTIERLDYVLGFPGALYVQHVERADVVIQQWEPGRDVSDHYGVQVGVDTTKQLLPADRPVGAVSVTLARFTCLQTTSGPGDDEVRFWLSATGDSGEAVTQSTPEVDDVEAGTVHDFELAALRLPDPGERLSVRVEGLELDDISADDSLGVARRVFDRQELLGLRDRAGPAAVTVTLPVLQGSGGEYVADVRLIFEA
jgi:endonuclease/exonuclease/phosphatase family metal-dependent hydrolase